MNMQPMVLLRVHLDEAFTYYLRDDTSAALR